MTSDEHNKDYDRHFPDLDIGPTKVLVLELDTDQDLTLVGSEMYAYSWIGVEGEPRRWALVADILVNGDLLPEKPTTATREQLRKVL